MTARFAGHIGPVDRELSRATPDFGQGSPPENGSFQDQVREMPYTAEYFFYRAP